jgi:hypothetical protein
MVALASFLMVMEGTRPLVFSSAVASATSALIEDF